MLSHQGHPEFDFIVGISFKDKKDSVQKIAYIRDAKYGIPILPDNAVCLLHDPLVEWKHLVNLLGVLVIFAASFPFLNYILSKMLGGQKPSQSD